MQFSNNDVKTILEQLY